MTTVLTVNDIHSWRQAARLCLQQGIAPEKCLWQDQEAAQLDLLGQAAGPTAAGTQTSFSIPPALLHIAEQVACHADPVKWALLYKVLWRLTHGEKHALALTSDPDIRRLMVMTKQVSRDAHKAKAFIRFRSLGAAENGRERFAAWHAPDHNILPLIAPFLQRRFSVMDWTVMTPFQSVSWDGQRLTTGPGVPKELAPPEDAMEEVWRTFYRAIFNPARIKLKMMKQEMPVRYWQTLPETRIIADMLQQAPSRVADMLRHQEGFSTSAADFIPAGHGYHALKAAAAKCEGCPLHCHATQAVFGSGPQSARLMIVGEQPDEEEDLAGQPFAGQAGKLLMEILAEEGIDPSQVYMTNAVKHFKFAQNGPRRVSQSPAAREINACKPWLARERQMVRPQVILGLGLTAAKSLLGHGFRMKDLRGQWFEEGDARVMITHHPSAVLRGADKAQGKGIYSQILSDVRVVKNFLSAENALRQKRQV